MTKQTANKNEMPAEVSQRKGWQRARKVASPLTTKLPSKRVTINIDEDIIAIFKTEAMLGGPPYQVAINHALRSFLRDKEKSANEQAAQTVLAALDEQAVVQKLRKVLKDTAA